MGSNEWYSKSFRRNLIDMHIEDWDERFLSKLEPEKYVALLKKAHVKGAMVYANSHVGYCNWPTRAGKMHGGLKGRDFLGEVFDLCRREGMDVILYYSLLYDNWAYGQHPAWRMIDYNGKASREEKIGKRLGSGGRYGICCPNSVGYREYTLAQIQDLCTHYQFQGVFFDMTFWQKVCYCPSCQARYADEIGGDMPSVVDWNDPKWVRFQKKREEWLNEFANLTTAAVKRLKPDVTVNHQFSTALHTWIFGVNEEFLSASDYCDGDFYRGFLEQSFICKLFYNLSEKKPFEFFTSRCTYLGDHTTTKSVEELTIQNAITLSHYGATNFIDAIDPAGTLNPEIYDLLGRVFESSRLYEPYLGGKLCQDIGIFYSLDSKMNFLDNGKCVVEDMSDQCPHLDAAVNTARILKENHIPFGVIGKKNLKDLSEFKAVILPDVHMMSDETAQDIRRYVKNGGSLYASGHTSPELLSDVFGILFKGITEETVTYIAPNDKGKTYFKKNTADYPLTVFDNQIKAEALNAEEVIATLVLPYTNPSDCSKFVSIHSNPPGINTGNPAMISRPYGKGKVIWAAGPMEAGKGVNQRETFAHIIKALVTRPFSFEAEAPQQVEILMTHQPERKRYLISVINSQDSLPPIPVYDIKIQVALDGKNALNAILLPGDKKISMDKKDGFAIITLSKLELFEMILLNYS